MSRTLVTVSCNIIKVYMCIREYECAHTQGVLVPVAARSNSGVCGRSLAGIVGSNSAGGHGCLSVVGVVYCQVEVSAWG